MENGQNKITRYFKNKKTSNEVPKTNMENSEPKFCSICQMPFSLLHWWELTEVHIISCLEINFKKLPPCLAGARCECSIRSHFAEFNHFSLAEFRDSAHLEFERETTCSEEYGSSSTEILNCSQKEMKTLNNNSKAISKIYELGKVKNNKDKNSAIKDNSKDSDSIRIISETGTEKSIKPIDQNASQNFKLKRVAKLKEEDKDDRGPKRMKGNIVSCKNCNCKNIFIARCTECNKIHPEAQTIDFLRFREAMLQSGKL